jgi:hypothetical protein
MGVTATSVYHAGLTHAEIGSGSLSQETSSTKAPMDILIIPINLSTTSFFSFFFFPATLLSFPSILFVEDDSLSLSLFSFSPGVQGFKEWVWIGLEIT